MSQQELVDISIDDLVIKVLNYYSYSHYEKSVVTFATVSKQWRRCIYKLSFIGLSVRLFRSDYDDFSLASFDNLKGISFMDTNPSTQLYSLESELFSSRISEGFAPLRKKKIESFVVSSTSLHLISRTFLSRYFSHVKILTLAGPNTTEECTYRLKSLLPHLECLRFSCLGGITGDLSLFNDIPLIDDLNIYYYTDVLGGAVLKNRTGKSVIRCIRRKFEIPLLNVVECFFIAGRLDINKPVILTTMKDGEVFRTYSGTLDKYFNPHGKGKTFVKDVVYEGEWDKGRFHGKGTYSDISLGKYEGDWVKGSMHGRGVLSVPDKYVYVGDFVNNMKEGHGLTTFADGDIYDGCMKGDYPHGFGRYTHAKCLTEYVGNYENGICQGEGTLYDLSPSVANGGQYYKGEFQDGKFHGKGKFVIDKKEVVNGQFSFGKFIEGRLNTPDDRHVLVGSFNTELGKYKGEEGVWLELSQYVECNELLKELEL